MSRGVGYGPAPALLRGLVLIYPWEAGELPPPRRAHVGRAEGDRRRRAQVERLAEDIEARREIADTATETPRYPSTLLTLTHKGSLQASQCSYSG